MIKKGLALEAAGLREDELELEVPSYFITGRLGGAHSLQRISGRALASRLEWISVGEPLLVLGLPGGVPVWRFFAASVCVRAVAGRCVWPPVASYVFAPAARCAS